MPTTVQRGVPTQGFYVGDALQENAEGGAGVWGPDRLPLPMRLDVANHSPTGFGWGYYGSGPAQLALAILVHATREPSTALRLYQVFKAEVIGRLPQGGAWMLSADEVRSWLRGQGWHPGDNPGDGVDNVRPC